MCNMMWWHFYWKYHEGTFGFALGKERYKNLLPMRMERQLKKT